MTSNDYFKRKSEELRNKRIEERKSQDQKLTPRHRVMNTIKEDTKPSSSKYMNNVFASPLKINKSPAFLRRGSVPVITQSLLDKAHKSDGIQEGSIPEKVKYHCVALGGPNVGKTTIIHKFYYNHYSDDYQSSDEQVSKRTFTLFGKQLTLSVLDTSGSRCSLNKLDLNKADGILLVYAVIDPSSWEHVIQLRKEILVRRSDIPILVVANKTDLCDSGSYDSIEELVELEWGNSFIATSAKNNDVMEIFMELLNQAGISFPLFAAISHVKSPHNRLEGRRSSTGLTGLSLLKNFGKSGKKK